MSKPRGRSSASKVSAPGAALSSSATDTRDKQTQNTKGTKGGAAGRPIVVLGNYVPVTIAVPDSVADGDTMYLSVEAAEGLDPSNAYSVNVRAFTGADFTTLDNSIIGAAGAYLELSHRGEDGTSFAMFPLTIHYPQNGVGDVSFKLQLSRVQNFSVDATVVGDTAATVVYL